VSMPDMYGSIASPRLERVGARDPDPHPSLLPREKERFSPCPPGEGRGEGQRPHVCFVAPTTWPLFSGDRDIPVVGGAEVQQSLIAPALAARGFKVSMIALDYGQQDRAQVKGVTVHKLYKPDAGIPVVRFLHPRLTTLWRVLGEVGADIYYQRSAAALTGFLAAYCKRHGKRAIYSGASDVDFLPTHPDIRYTRDRYIFQYGLRTVDRIFAQNATQQAWALANFGRDSVHVPNCYDPPPGAKADPGGYVLWVATVREQKRPELLLEMARRMPHRRFVMVGGHDDDRVGQLYIAHVREALKTLPNVEYRGFVPFAEADRVFDGARVLVNTSSYEGFPNTFLQAWARGVPTVAFVDTASRDAQGPVYDVAADIDAAAAGVERLMSDDAAWAKASARVAAHFRRHHSLAAVVDVYERELMALAAGR
jgi:glycosyltransferase involved in cell wall biosynthesis